MTDYILWSIHTKNTLFRAIMGWVQASDSYDSYDCWMEFDSDLTQALFYKIMANMIVILVLFTNLFV